MMDFSPANSKLFWFAIIKTKEMIFRLIPDHVQKSLSVRPRFNWKLISNWNRSQNVDNKPLQKRIYVDVWFLSSPRWKSISSCAQFRTDTYDLKNWAEEEVSLASSGSLTAISELWEFLFRASIDEFAYLAAAGRVSYRLWAERL